MVTHALAVSIEKNIGIAIDLHQKMADVVMDLDGTMLTDHVRGKVKTVYIIHDLLRK